MSRNAIVFGATSGIGKELAKLLGGEVDFESELGRGSSFWVDLPWRLNDDPAVELMPRTVADHEAGSAVSAAGESNLNLRPS